ncbi:hypothetical protein BC829DRAFT_421152 [Chytridium lagenaria]|nr:hypothetical protein BC829DRAFT_421152 [Chytridium lagenaria]
MARLYALRQEQGQGSVGILSVDSDMLLQPFFTTVGCEEMDVTVIHYNDRTTFRPVEMRYVGGDSRVSHGRLFGGDVGPVTVSWDVGVCVLAVCGNDTFPGLRRGGDEVGVEKGLEKGVGGLFLGRGGDRMDGSLNSGVGDASKRVQEVDEERMDAERKKVRMRKVELWLRSLAWMVGSSVEANKLMEEAGKDEKVVVSAETVTVEDVLWWMGDEGVGSWEEVLRRGEELQRGRGRGGLKEGGAITRDLFPSAETHLVHGLLRGPIDEYDEFCETVRSKYMNDSATQEAMMAAALEHVDATTRSVQAEVRKDSECMPFNVRLDCDPVSRIKTWTHSKEGRPFEFGVPLTVKKKQVDMRVL